MKKTLSSITKYILIIALIFSGTIPSPVHADNGTINFAGYQWTVKDGFMGPGGNYWNSSPSAVFVDSAGLHLKVTQRDNRWYSSEVYLPTSLGYGTYEWDILNTPSGRVDQIDPNLVFATFLYADDTREYDVEFTNWQNSVQTPAQYVVQPYPPTSNLVRFPLPLSNGILTNRIYWSEERVTFSTLQNGRVLREWNYTGPNKFTPGDERVHINYWMINHTPPSDFREKEIIVSNFRYSGLPRPPTSLTNQTPYSTNSQPVYTQPNNSFARDNNLNHELKPLGRKNPSRIRRMDYINPIDPFIKRKNRVR